MHTIDHWNIGQYKHSNPNNGMLCYSTHNHSPIAVNQNTGFPSNSNSVFLPKKLYSII